MKNQPYHIACCLSLAAWKMKASPAPHAPPKWGGKMWSAKQSRINEYGRGRGNSARPPQCAANTCRDWVFKRRPPRPWLTGPIDFLGFCRHRFPASQRPRVGGQGAPGLREPALATSQSEGPLKENQSCHKWEASKIFPLYGQDPSACLHSVAKVRHLSSRTRWKVLEMPVNPWVDRVGVLA